MNMLLLLQASKHWYSDPLADAVTLATIIIAAATIIGVVISNRMWKVTRDYTETTKEYTKATKEYTEITKNIFEAAYRPYVTASEFMASTNESTGQFKITVEFENVGSVPAYDFRRHIEINAGSKQVFIEAVQFHHIHSAMLFPHKPLTISGSGSSGGGIVHSPSWSQNNSCVGIAAALTLLVTD
jgi:hypothetical protein